MNDSIQLLGTEIIILSKQQHFKDIENVHRRMSALILNTARHNQGNALGRYINDNYKKTEFK